ncbi:hypothetical protein CRUP_000342, partial [Coryphaenoides rupestris]
MLLHGLSSTSRHTSSSSFSDNCFTSSKTADTDVSRQVRETAVVLGGLGHQTLEPLVPLGLVSMGGRGPWIRGKFSST